MRDPSDEHHEEERLSALLDDELSDGDALTVTRHLAECGRCMAELEEIRSARSALRDLPRVDPPPELIPAAAQAAARGRHRRRIRRGVAATLLLSALAALLAVGAAGRDGIVPPVDTYIVQHVTRAGTGPVPVPLDLSSPAR